MTRTRPIQPKPLGECRLLLIHAAADAQAADPLVGPLRRSGADLDVRIVEPHQPFEPGWLSPKIQDADRVVVLWSAAAMRCPLIEQIDATSGARYRNRVHLVRVDDTPVPEHLERFLRPRLAIALNALGTGTSRFLPQRLADHEASLRRAQRRSWTAFALTAALALGAALITEPPLLRFAFIGPAFLTFGTGFLLRYWAWINRRYQGQRIALVLADRALG
jgi:hypothetical protein